MNTFMVIPLYLINIHGYELCCTTRDLFLKLSFWRVIAASSSSSITSSKLCSNVFPTSVSNTATTSSLKTNKSGSSGRIWVLLSTFWIGSGARSYVTLCTFVGVRGRDEAGGVSVCTAASASGTLPLISSNHRSVWIVWCWRLSAPSLIRPEILDLLSFHIIQTKCSVLKYVILRSGRIYKIPFERNPSLSPSLLEIRFLARALAAVRLALGDNTDIPSLETEGDWR